MRAASFLIVAASCFVVLFAVAAAMDFQTEFTISSTVWNKDMAAKCQKEIKKQQKLFACQRYLLKSSKMSPTSPSTSPSSPSMSDDNNNQASINWREEFPECCEQLEKISEKCRCTAVEEILQQLKDETEESGWEDVDTEEMLLTAKSLPNLCRMKPQYCYIETGPSEGGM